MVHEQALNVTRCREWGAIVFLLGRIGHNSERSGGDVVFEARDFPAVDKNMAIVFSGVEP